MTTGDRSDATLLLGELFPSAAVVILEGKTAGRFRGDERGLFVTRHSHPYVVNDIGEEQGRWVDRW